MAKNEPNDLFGIGCYCEKKALAAEDAIWAWVGTWSGVFSKCA